MQDDQDRPEGEGTDETAAAGAPEASGEQAGAPPANVDVQALLQRLATLEGEVGDLRSSVEELSSRVDALGLSQGDINTRLSGVQERVTQLEENPATAPEPGPNTAEAAAELAAAPPAPAAPPSDADLGPFVELGDVASGALIHYEGEQYVVVGPVAGSAALEDAQVKVRQGGAAEYFDPRTQVQVLEQPAA